MKVILKETTFKRTQTKLNDVIYKPKTQAQLVNVLRELWEQEYNSWDYEPDREESYFEEDYCKVENDIKRVEFRVLPLIEMEE